MGSEVLAAVDARGVCAVGERGGGGGEGCGV